MLWRSSAIWASRMFSTGRVAGGAGSRIWIGGSATVWADCLIMVAAVLGTDSGGETWAVMRPPPRWKRIWRRICAGPVTRSRAGISPARAAAPAALRTDSPSSYFAPPVTRRTVAPSGESEFVALLFKEQWPESRLPGYWRIGGWNRRHGNEPACIWKVIPVSMPHGATANPALYNPLLAKRDPLACRNGAEIHQ